MYGYTGRNYEIQLKCQNYNCVNYDYFTQNGSGAILGKIVTVDTHYDYFTQNVSGAILGKIVTVDTIIILWF
jgi:hypothetical protein